MSRSALGLPGRRDESPTEAAFRAAVKARASGRCEACITHELEACNGRGDHTHHMLMKSRGPGWELLHDPEANGLRVSWVHHGWIHGHPARAHALGFLPYVDEVVHLERAAAIARAQTLLIPAHTGGTW